MRAITWMQRRGLCVRQFEAGFGPKTRNRAFVARFRVCGVKQWCGTITGGGGSEWMAWRQRRGLRLHQREAGGRDLGQKPESEPSWLGFGRAV